MLVVKGLFPLFLLLALISGLIGFVGDGLLGGLSDSIDIFLHAIAQEAASFESLLDQVCAQSSAALPRSSASTGLDAFEPSRTLVAFELKLQRLI